MNFFTNTSENLVPPVCTTSCSKPVTCPVCPPYRKCVCDKKNYNNEYNNKYYFHYLCQEKIYMILLNLFH